MEHVIPTLTVVIVAAMLLATRAKNYTPDELRLVSLSFAAHVASAVGQVLITEDVYGGGDMLNYAMFGKYLSEMMARNFSVAAPEVFDLLIQVPTSRLYAMEPGTPSGSMCALAGFLMYFLNGSLYAACMLISLVSFFGKTAMYRVFRESLTVEDRPRVLFATLLVPSVVFWSSGILKESVAIGALGWMFLGAHRMIGRKYVTGIVLVALGAGGIGIMKPYILFPFLLAAGVWAYLERTREVSGRTAIVVRPAYLIAFGALAIGGIVLLGTLFPEFAVEKFGAESARYQEVGGRITAGSSYEMGDATDRSLAGQLLFSPVALVASLFRPFMFEVRNGQMFAAALETTTIMVLFLRALWKRKWAGLWRLVWASPVLVFSIVFTLLFAVAVGLVTTNLGTLSRYRMPLMPFYAALVFMMGSRAAVEEDAPAAAAQPDT